jgi:predicted secreted protein
MAELVYKNAMIKLGSSAGPSTDLHPYVRSITINYAAEIQDKTAMTDTFRSRIAGLKTWDVTIEWNQDYADGLVDDELFALVGVSSTACWMVIKPTTAAAAVTNPRFYGRAVLESYSPVSGAVGDLATVSTVFQGDGTLTRSESS